MGRRITFAYTSFIWTNLASRNAGVTVVVIGLGGDRTPAPYKIFDNKAEEDVVRLVPNISAYLTSSSNIIVQKMNRRNDDLQEMDFGNKAVDGGNLYMSRDDKEIIERDYPAVSQYIRRVYGAVELVGGLCRYCLWIGDDHAKDAEAIEPIAARLAAVKKMRLESQKAPTRAGAAYPHKFEERRQIGRERIIALPRITSENRDYLPADLFPSSTIISSQLFGFYDCPLLISPLSFLVFTGFG